MGRSVEMQNIIPAFMDTKFPHRILRSDLTIRVRRCWANLLSDSLIQEMTQVWKMFETDMVIWKRRLRSYKMNLMQEIVDIWLKQGTKYPFEGEEAYVKLTLKDDENYFVKVTFQGGIQPQLNIMWRDYTKQIHRSNAKYLTEVYNNLMK